MSYKERRKSSKRDIEDNWHEVSLKGSSGEYQKVFEKSNTPVKTLIILNESGLWAKYGFDKYPEENFDRLGPRGARVFYGQSIPEELWMAREQEEEEPKIKVGRFSDRVEFKPSGEMWIEQSGQASMTVLSGEALFSGSITVDDIELVEESRVFGKDPADDFTAISVDDNGEVDVNANILDTDNNETNPSTEESLTSEQPRRVSNHDDSTYDVASSEDISGGVSQSLNMGGALSLFISVEGAIDITVEMSPDEGTTWYEIPESVLSYDSAGDDIIEMGYVADKIRFTGSNTTETTIQIKEVQ